MSRRNIDRREFGERVVGGVFTGLAGATAGCSQEAQIESRPNILLILADDMGFSDLGCFGGEIETPNLDRLARNGLRYTSFYNTSRCCPTRASLLTGLYAHQTGMGWMTAADLGHPGYTGDLSANSVTIAEVLRQAGYRTYLSGKWHVTHDRFIGREASRHNWPCQRGFDHFFGIIGGGGSYFSPDSLTRDNTRISAGDAFYLTDALSEAALSMLEEHFASANDQPFFLYLSYTAPHFPVHAKPEDIEKYRGRYLVGWDHLRVERHERMISERIVDESWILSDRDTEIPAWADLSAEQRAEMDLRMAIYAAQIDCMDQGIGKLLASLEKSGALENTAVFFLSDNGGTHEFISRGDTSMAALGTDASFESYRKPWANASNTPFRLYKHWVHEGGISTPLIVHWPAGISEQNRLRPQVGHVIDMMPTCVELAAAKYPIEFGGNPIPPPEGQSLVPSFGGGFSQRGQLFWEHESNRAVRHGHWKLVARGIDGPWELYDLETDRTELLDLAAQNPQRVKELGDAWQNWAERCQVLPLDDRGWSDRLNS